MSISELAPGASPADVLADAAAAVRGLAEVLWSARSDDELVEVVGQVQQVTAALAAVEAGAVAEADARDLATQKLHYGSTVDWLTHLAGLRHGEGKQRVARAKALTGPLSRTQDALVDGMRVPGAGRRGRRCGGGSAGPGVDPPAGGEADAPPRPHPERHRAG